MAAPFRDDPGPPRNRAAIRVSRKSRRHPGLHEIAPAIRGPDESAPAISLGGFVGWFRGVVS